MNLESLNDDVLLIIFDYCMNNDLKSLGFVSKKFKDLIETRIFYKRSLDLLICGHRGKGIQYQRTLHDLSYQKRLKLYENWRMGRYEELAFFSYRVLTPTKIFLERDLFYIARGGQIRAHRRLYREHLERKIYYEIGKQKDHEIICFAKKNDVIFAGRSTGSALIHNSDSTEEQRLHSELINCVDFYQNSFVSTTNACTKIWTKYEEFGMISLEPSGEINEPFQYIKINPNGNQFVGGKFKDREKKALRLIDFETQTTTILGSLTSAVYYILWKDENCLLTANYDTTFRLFDLRTNNDEMIWQDPYDSSVYCLDYDGMNGVLCGMKYHCRVNLYDLRVKKKFIQMYFPSLRRSMGSPVYSLACDATQLFIATDHNIRLFNFNVHYAKYKDYSNIFIND